MAVLGELHPMVQEQHDLGEAPVQVARFDLDVLQELVPLRRDIQPVSSYTTPVLEDLALVVDEQRAGLAGGFPDRPDRRQSRHRRAFVRRLPR